MNYTFIENNRGEYGIQQYSHNNNSPTQSIYIISYCSMCYLCVIVALFIFCLIIYLNRG